MDINIKRQFDQTNPFAQVKETGLQIRHWQDRIRPTRKGIPPEVWDHLADQFIAQQRTARPPQYEQPGHLSALEVPAWKGERDMSSSLPTVIYRPRRIARHIPWQWRLIFVGIRLARMMRKSAKQQMKRFNKLRRQMIRRVLPHRNAIRVRAARRFDSVRVQTEVCRVCGLHPGQGWEFSSHPLFRQCWCGFQTILGCCC